MGEFRECHICKIDGSACFKGFAWIGPTGVYDAEWSENGQKKQLSFRADGKPIGFWNAYLLELA